jgi:hypothetical protein
MSLSDAKKARAEAAFKRKEDQAQDGAKAWAEYEAKSRAVAKNMARLRALRLAKQPVKSDAANCGIPGFAVIVKYRRQVL